ncbi:MAG: hypothetical protein KDD31_07930 [Muricauda sp.]|nr:hypothetical protein [Allomuricauda sp.]
MEFFRIVQVQTDESTIQNQLTLANLDSMSNEIFIIGDQTDTEANIGGIWGEFTLTRNRIRGGIRFALVECPNALAWTLTAGFEPDPESLVVHLTINRQQKSQSFLEEVEDFLDDHTHCLKQFLETLKVQG